MTTAQPTVAVSDHAIARWVERFPGHDLAEAFDRAVPVSAGRMVAWGHHVTPGDEYFYDRATNALFAVSSARGRRRLVTIYPCRRSVRTGRRQRR